MNESLSSIHTWAVQSSGMLWWFMLHFSPRLMSQTHWRSFPHSGLTVSWPPLFSFHCTSATHRQQTLFSLVQWDYSFLWSYSKAVDPEDTVIDKWWLDMAPPKAESTEEHFEVSFIFQKKKVDGLLASYATKVMLAGARGVSSSDLLHIFNGVPKGKENIYCMAR